MLDSPRVHRALSDPRPWHVAPPLGSAWPACSPLPAQAPPPSGWSMDITPSAKFSWPPYQHHPEVGTSPWHPQRLAQGRVQSLFGEFMVFYIT